MDRIKPYPADGDGAAAEVSESFDDGVDGGEDDDDDAGDDRPFFGGRRGLVLTRREQFTGLRLLPLRLGSARGVLFTGMPLSLMPAIRYAGRVSICVSSPRQKKSEL